LSLLSFKGRCAFALCGILGKAAHGFPPISDTDHSNSIRYSPGCRLESIAWCRFILLMSRRLLCGKQFAQCPLALSRGRFGIAPNLLYNGFLITLIRQKEPYYPISADNFN